MEKKATINLRIDNDLKSDAEQILNRLGLTMSTAITLFLRQVELTGGLPFPVQLPPGPKHLDASTMSKEDFNHEMNLATYEIEQGDTLMVSDYVAAFNSSKKND